MDGQEKNLQLYFLPDKGIEFMNDILVNKKSP
jgi:hypothetical protein